jgi:SAM-dependent methyltransferase
VTISFDRQLDYWNTFGPTKPFSHPLPVERFGGLVERNGPILDVGCGYGRTLETLHAAGYAHLTGVDIAPAMIDLAQRRVPSASLHRVDAGGRLPFADHTFSAALLVSVLTCVPTDQGQRALIADIARVLRPGGVVFVSDLWLQTDRRNVERYERDCDRFGVYGCFSLPEGVVVRHHDREWIASLLERFEQLTLDDLTVTTMNGNRASGFQYFGRAPDSSAHS